MPASPADSPLYARLFNDDEAARLFSDSAEVRAMLLVEGALAKEQGALGVIPAEAAAFLHRASFEVQIDPSALAAETARNVGPVQALVAAFRTACNAPDYAAFAHCGAASQDIMDTALALRLKRLIELWEGRLDALLAALATLAEACGDEGQAAVPRSFGAVVAGWGWPLIVQRQALVALRPQVLQVSLSGEGGPQVQAELARALGLCDPGQSGRGDRSGIGTLAGWMAVTAKAIGKMGADLRGPAQSGLPEAAISRAPLLLVALSRQVVGLTAMLHDAVAQGHDHDGAGWLSEWLNLPQAAILTSRALGLALDVAGRVSPEAMAMVPAPDTDAGLAPADARRFAQAARAIA